MRVAAAAAVAGLTAAGAPFELVEEDVLGARIAVFKNRARSLGQLLADSRAHGDRTYLATSASTLTFQEHAAQVASLAVALRDEYGVRRGDRVAIAAANSPEWVIAFWATVSLGAVAVAFNAWWTRPEVAWALDHVKPTVVVADRKRTGLLPDVPVLIRSEERRVGKAWRCKESPYE